MTDAEKVIICLLMAIFEMLDEGHNLTAQGAASMHAARELLRQEGAIR
jgi:hypothetical protein